MRRLGRPQWEPVTRVSTQRKEPSTQPQTTSSSLPSRRPRHDSRGSRGQEAASCPCSAPKPQGSVRRTETPSVYEEPRQLCLAEHSPAVLMPAPGEHSPPPGLTLSHSWGQPGWAAWAEVSPLAPRSAATRNANCCQPPTQGKGGAAWLLQVEGSPWQPAHREETAWLATWG